jgi:hypothetical protein
MFPHKLFFAYGNIEPFGCINLFGCGYVRHGLFPIDLPEKLIGILFNRQAYLAAALLSMLFYVIVAVLRGEAQFAVVPVILAFCGFGRGTEFEHDGNFISFIIETIKLL